MLPAPARPARDTIQPCFHFHFFRCPGVAPSGDLCPKAGWPQSSVPVRAAKGESRGVGVPAFEGACPRERKCLARPSGSQDRAILAVGQERGGRRPRPKGGLGWRGVAGTLQALHRARSPTTTFPSDLCPAGSPAAPTPFPQLEAGFWVQPEEWKVWPWQGAVSATGSVTLWSSFGQPRCPPGCEPSLTTSGAKGHRIRKWG